MIVDEKRHSEVQALGLVPMVVVHAFSVAA